MRILTALVLAFTLSSFAHDEGHGPKLRDAGRRGGRVTAVVLAKDASLGPSAKMLYKGEIVRSKKDRTAKIYFYDDKMTSLKLENFAKTAKATMISGKAGKEVMTDFELTLQGDHYVGTYPKTDAKRYNIDVKVTEGDKDLLAAFDNLD